eukprot:m.272806 g.272806  ORF g.272806 m.272806 type:complete len:80 (+) comp19750_c0_seq1:281-520(+)
MKITLGITTGYWVLDLSLIHKNNIAQENGIEQFSRPAGGQSIFGDDSRYNEQDSGRVHDFVCFMYPFKHLALSVSSMPL